MRIFSFDGEDLKMMLVGSVNLLGESKAEINVLNVFPVPDGDTGSNMYLTLLAGVKEAIKVGAPDIGEVAGAAARGALYGARGNSGVILSQLLKGFAAALTGQSTAGAGDVARAFRMASDAAYEAVAEPVEGTILSVCRETADAFQRAVDNHADLPRIMIYAYKYARLALDKTPEQLPVLKQAGVVDAGGKGFVTILAGIIRALKDAAAQRKIELFDLATSQQKEFVETWARDFGVELEYIYCTEFIIQGKSIPVTILRRELEPYGDCLLVVGDQETTKVHIHSNHPGLVLECGLKYGALQEVQINNMEEQGQEFLPSSQDIDKNTGLVAVGLGEGITTILKSMGADMVVAGGQTMNPSAEDLLQAIDSVPAAAVIVLPNNKNIILAAEQAAAMSEKQVAVVPAATIPQGITALLSYNPLQGLQENQEKMGSSYAGLRTGEITRAVRDSKAGGLEIKKGQLIGLADGRLWVCGEDLDVVTSELIACLAGEDGELVTLYFGDGVSEAQTRVLADALAERFPEIDFEFYYGGQPLYQFIISAE